MHYQRWWKYGDPEKLLSTYTICSVEGCNRVPRSTRVDLCEMHYYRKRRHGDPTFVMDTRLPDAKYRSAHARVARDKGKARHHLCVDCGKQAQHWSYTHTDPEELVSPGGQSYSLRSEHYEPRCAPCHAIFDGTGANQFTSNTK
jgi:hypothetical protein